MTVLYRCSNEWFRLLEDVLVLLDDGLGRADFVVGEVGWLSLGRDDPLRRRLRPLEERPKAVEDRPEVGTVDVVPVVGDEVPLTKLFLERFDLLAEALEVFRRLVGE